MAIVQACRPRPVLAVPCSPRSVCVYISSVRICHYDPHTLQLACMSTGKSSLAQALAARLNMPNVLQTDVVCELLRGRALPIQSPWQQHTLPSAPEPMAGVTPSGPSHGEPNAQAVGTAKSAATAPAPASAPADRHSSTLQAAIPASDSGLSSTHGKQVDGLTHGSAGGSSRDLNPGLGPSGFSCREPGHAADIAEVSPLVSAWRAECAVVRQCLQGEIAKACSDGKPLILEGTHLDPDVLLSELQVI